MRFELVKPQNNYRSLIGEKLREFLTIRNFIKWMKTIIKPSLIYKYHEQLQN